MNPTVLYESPRARLLLGDARELIRDVGAESVDLVVVDPPYGVEWQSGFRAEGFGAESHEPYALLAAERLMRVDAIMDEAAGA